MDAPTVKVMRLLVINSGLINGPTCYKPIKAPANCSNGGFWQGRKSITVIILCCLNIDFVTIPVVVQTLNKEWEKHILPISDIEFGLVHASLPNFGEQCDQTLTSGGGPCTLTTLLPAHNTVPPPTSVSHLPAQTPPSLHFGG